MLSFLYNLENLTIFSRNALVGIERNLNNFSCLKLKDEEDSHNNIHLISIISFLRRANYPEKDVILVVSNFY